MKTTKLVVDYDYDFKVLALISSVKAYKLAWAVNKLLNVQLCKSEDIHFDLLNESNLCFTNYVFETEYYSLRMVKNKACEFNNVSKPFFLPELKEYDFILMLGGEVFKEEYNIIIEKVKSLSIVQYIKYIEVENLKSKENLIF